MLVPAGFRAKLDAIHHRSRDGGKQQRKEGVGPDSREYTTNDKDSRAAQPLTGLKPVPKDREREFQETKRKESGIRFANFLSTQGL